MRGPRDKRRPAQPGQDGGPSDLNFERLDANTHSGRAAIPQAGLRRRPIRPDEIANVRAAWWRLAAAGLRLPAERGTILLDGGANG